MRDTRDSFLAYLRTELPSLSIHNVRTDPEVPEVNQLKLNAVNVTFLDARFDVHISEQDVSIDVIHKDELTALNMCRDVFFVLSNFFIQKYDYTNPSSPVTSSSKVYWDRDAIQFLQIPSEGYHHFNATFALKHYLVIT